MGGNRIFISKNDGYFVLCLDDGYDIGPRCEDGDAKYFMLLKESERERHIVDQSIPILRIECEIVKLRR